MGFTYGLVQYKERKPRKPVFKEDRSMTVYEGSTKDYKVVPQIRMQGQWLDELGFAPGKKMNVHCEEGKLTITIEN